MTLRALIFDVDGTLAETEEVHRRAFNRAFADAGLDWHWSRERYRELLKVSGGRERIRRFLADQQLGQLRRADIEERITALHKAKTALYAEMMAGGAIEPRPGVERLIREARRAGPRLAIASTTSMSNITALFDAAFDHEILGWFEVIGAAEQAPQKKPDPSVYRLVLERLGLPASDCLAFEDTNNGVRAALAAGIAVVVTPSEYSEGEDFSGALAVLSDLGAPDRPYRVPAGVEETPAWVDFEQLQRWLAAANIGGKSL